jgi:hypothetical protein
MTNGGKVCLEDWNKSSVFCQAKMGVGVQQDKIKLKKKTPNEKEEEDSAMDLGNAVVSMHVLLVTEIS